MKKIIEVSANYIALETTQLGVDIKFLTQDVCILSKFADELLIAEITDEIEIKYLENTISFSTIKDCNDDDLTELICGTISKVFNSKPTLIDEKSKKAV